MNTSDNQLKLVVGYSASVEVNRPRNRVKIVISFELRGTRLASS